MVARLCPTTQYFSVAAASLSRVASSASVSSSTVTAEVDTDADDAMLDKLAAATEKYCVVGQSLKSPPRFVVTRQR